MWALIWNCIKLFTSRQKIAAAVVEVYETWWIELPFNQILTCTKWIPQLPLSLFKHDESPYDPECIREEETPACVVFYYPLLEKDRKETEEVLNRGLMPQNIVTSILESQVE